MVVDSGSALQRSWREKKSTISTPSVSRSFEMASWTRCRSQTRRTTPAWRSNSTERLPPRTTSLDINESPSAARPRTQRPPRQPRASPPKRAVPSTLGAGLARPTGPFDSHSADTNCSRRSPSLPVMAPSRSASHPHTGSSARMRGFSVPGRRWRARSRRGPTQRTSAAVPSGTFQAASLAS